MIHTIPVLVKLRARYPAARIDWLITPENAELVRHNPALSQVVYVPAARLRTLRPELVGDMPALCGCWPRYGRNRYDLVIDMHGQFRSALFTLVTGADDPHRFRPAATRDPGAVGGAPRGLGHWQHGW